MYVFDHFAEMNCTFRIESDAMKLHYTLFVFAIIVIGGLFIILNPLAVSAENSKDHFVEQPQISALVTMAIPPYKW
jgi:hypothetical protein